MFIMRLSDNQVTDLLMKEGFTYDQAKWIIEWFEGFGNVEWDAAAIRGDFTTYTTEEEALADEFEGDVLDDGTVIGHI